MGAKVNLKGFTFLLTAQCNFRCSYCIQEKTDSYLSLENIQQAVDFFFPDFADGCRIGFYGGEPLLAFDRMRETVEYIEKKRRENGKRIYYDLTTNGSLLNEDVLSFLKDHRFTLLLSCDGLAQEQMRKQGSLKSLLKVFDSLNRNSCISYWVHSVYTPATVHLLVDSILFLEQKGVKACTFTIDLHQPWDYGLLCELRKQVLEAGNLWKERRDNRGAIRILNFSSETSTGGIFCSAGKDRLAMSPDGGIWACAVPAALESAKEKSNRNSEFFIGTILELDNGWGKLQDNTIRRLNDMQFEQCFAPDSLCTQCKLMENCFVCPYEKSAWQKLKGTIPPWICSIVSLIWEEKKRASVRESRPLL